MYIYHAKIKFPSLFISISIARYLGICLSFDSKRHWGEHRNCVKREQFPDDIRRRLYEAEMRRGPQLRKSLVQSVSESPVLLARFNKPYMWRISDSQRIINLRGSLVLACLRVLSSRVLFRERPYPRDVNRRWRKGRQFLTTSTATGRGEKKTESECVRRRENQ